MLVASLLAISECVDDGRERWNAPEVRKEETSAPLNGAD
jgi:hypothetical protein